MNQFHDEIGLFAVLGEPLTRPNHGYASMSQLCRRLRISDDLGRRGVAKLEERFRGPLTGMENHRRTLTALGRRVLDLGRQLRDLEESGEGGTEILTVECSPCVAEALLPRVLPTFLDIFGGLVRLRICDLDPAAVRQNINTNRTDFGIGVIAEDDERHSGMEVLEAPIPWLLLVPAGHKLGHSVGPVAGSDLRPDNRIFLPSYAAALPSLGQWVRGVESGYRVETDSVALIQRFVEANLGLGVTPDFGCEAISNGLAVRPIAGVEEQRLCFYMPRRAAEHSEAASALADAIRKQVEILKGESRVSTEPASESTLLPVGNGDFGGLPLTSLEATHS